MNRAVLQGLSLASVALAWLGGTTIDFAPSAGSLQIGTASAEARSSGGRSRGGSFSRPSSPSRSGGDSGGSYGGGGYVGPIGGGYGYGGGYFGGGFGSLLLLTLLGGGIILPIMWMYMMQAARQSRQGGGGYSGGRGEVDNDIVTVTRLQVALLSQAKYIQESLTELTLQANTESAEGLTDLLQETVLALLRSPENWTHVRANSETVKSREAAGQLFERLSIEERSKFTSETLANVGGRVRRAQLTVPTDEDPAAYIVVTLLVGTADDRPLIKDPIRSTEDLRDLLQRLGGVTSDYLMVFELLWSPQDAADSLTYDELLTEYPDMVQL